MATRMPEAEFGRGEPPTDVAWLHGWLGAPSVFDGVVAKLPGMRHRRIPLPGLAGTTPLPSGLSETCDRIASELAEVAAGGSRPILVGHSLGGLVAAHLAARPRAPVCGVVLLAPVPPTGLPLPAPDMERFAALCDEDADLGAFFTPQFPAGTVSARLLQGARAWPPRARRTYLRIFTRRYRAPAVPPECPVVVAPGEFDPYLPPALLEPAFAETAPHARLSVVPSAGHYPPLEAPGVVARIVAAAAAGAEPS